MVTEMSTAADIDRVTELAKRVVAEHDPSTVPIPEFLGACYDVGLSWVACRIGHCPVGVSGKGRQCGATTVDSGRDTGSPLAKTGRQAVGIVPMARGVSR